jgi:threonine synthase
VDEKGYKNKIPHLIVDTLICSLCGKNYADSGKAWRCECGGPFDLAFSARFPLDKIEQRDPSMWRYREAIPIKSPISFQEGFTPLIEVDVGDRPVLIKQDHLFQTGSFKDRGASVLISRAKELGVTDVVEDSSGNAGSAIAAYCAMAGIGCDIFVPEGAPEGKLAQIRQYGAKVHKKGDRAYAADAAIEASEKTYYASHCWNPYFLHGTKTFAFEVCEQLGWESPDVVVLPVGNGTLFLGAYIGFNELLACEIIDSIPKLIAIRPEDKKNTVAKGIAIENPVRGAQIFQAIKATNGKLISVSDSEILDSYSSIGRKGFFIEPASAATIAGLAKCGCPEETVVSVFTGHGLKQPNIGF